MSSHHEEKKKRLDVFLSETGRSVSRESAKREIIAGWVKVNDETVRTPSHAVTGDEKIEIARPGGIFVSRGGLKLEKALKHFSISLQNQNAVDLGASTGGFTDCMLKAGADVIYSVDVGYGQLDYSLRNNSRVIVMERRNARSLAKSDFNHRIDFVSADLSFISVLKIYGTIKELFSHARGIILIKPQFESEKSEQKKGVVREKSVHIAILTRVITSLVEMDMGYRGLTFSPVKGPAGNIEFLLYFDNSGNNPGKDVITHEINKVVESAHLELAT